MFDSNISGEIIPEVETPQNMWESFVSLGIHGYYHIGRVRRFDRIYFVKAISPEWRGDQNVARMLMKEFSALAKLSHPGVIKVLDFYKESPFGPCILMDYVDGRNLKDFLHEHNSTSMRLKVAHQLLSAMAFVHNQNIVHRDLKPENILVSHGLNQVKIIDFGLADFPEAATLKKVGGNNQYSASEVVEGAYANPRQDVYSLGILLKEFKLPFYYNYVLRRATAKDKEKRYAGASTMLLAFKNTKRVFVASIVAVAALVMLPIIFIGQDLFSPTANSAYSTDSIFNNSTVENPVIKSDAPAITTGEQPPVLQSEISSEPRDVSTAPIKQENEAQSPAPLTFSPSWPKERVLTAADTTTFINAYREDAEKYTRLTIERGKRPADKDVLLKIISYYNSKTGVYTVQFPSFREKIHGVDDFIQKVVISQ